jgi:hypothetical protein
MHTLLCTRSQRTPTRTHDGVTQRATSCSDRSDLLRHGVRRRASEWKRLGASEQVLGWIRRGVRIPLIGSQQSPSFNNGIPMLDAAPQQLDFINSELPRFMDHGALESGKRII